MKKIRKIKELYDMILNLSSILVPEPYKTYEGNAGYFGFSSAIRQTRRHS